MVEDPEDSRPTFSPKPDKESGASMATPGDKKPVPERGRKEGVDYFHQPSTAETHNELLKAGKLAHEKGWDHLAFTNHYGSWEYHEHPFMTEIREKKKREQELKFRLKTPVCGHTLTLGYNNATSMGPYFWLTCSKCKYTQHFPVPKTVSGVSPAPEFILRHAISRSLKNDFCDTISSLSIDNVHALRLLLS